RRLVSSWQLRWSAARVPPFRRRGIERRQNQAAHRPPAKGGDRRSYGRETPRGPTCAGTGPRRAADRFELAPANAPERVCRRQTTQARPRVGPDSGRLPRASLIRASTSSSHNQEQRFGPVGGNLSMNRVDPFILKGQALARRLHAPASALAHKSTLVA